MLLFVVIITILATLASADVSHLDSFKHYFPASTDVGNYTPQKSNNPLQSFTQIESIKASVPVASFTIQKNIGQQQYLDANIYPNAQSTDAYKYNAPVQQHYSTVMQQQTLSVPASASIQQLHSSSPDQAPVQNAYLPPAIEPHHSGAPHKQQSIYSAPAPAQVQQTYTAPAQNSYLPPSSQQQYSTSSPIQQQSYSAPASVPVEQQSYSAPFSAPVQHSFSLPVPVQQQSYSSAIHNQEQSEQQPQSNGDVKTTSAVDNGAYNYQVPDSAPAPVLQNFPPPIPGTVQQMYSNRHNVNQQSYSSSAGEESGSFNYQPSVPVQQSYSNTAAAPVQQSHLGVQMTSAVDNGANNYQAPAPVPIPALVQQSFSVPASAPVQQTYNVPSHHSSSAAIDSASFNYHPSIPSQESLSNPASALFEQSHSAPASDPIHQTVAASVGGESGSYNYQAAKQQQYSTPVQQSYSAPVIAPIQQTISTSSGAPVQQSHSGTITTTQSEEFLTPAIHLSAPAASPEVGTVYGKNGGYVYRKF